MTISMYETREMMTLLDQAKRPRSFLMDTFFSTRSTTTAKHVDVDIRMGLRRLAPFQHPALPSTVVDKIGYTTQTYIPPLISPKMIFTGVDLDTRAPGEHVYTRVDGATRAQQDLALALAELQEMGIRRTEWMAAQALFLSQIAIVGAGVNRTITYPRPAANMIAYNADHDFSDNAVPIIQTLNRWRRIVLQASGTNPDTVVMGALAAEAMLANTAFRDALDTRRLDLGTIAPELLDNGATYYGQLTGTGLQIWGYDEWYIDADTGVEMAMVPEAAVLLGSTRARTDLKYAGIDEIVGEPGNEMLVRVEGMWVPRLWIENDPAMHFLRVSSAPLPIPTENNAFLVATVLDL